MLQQIYTDRIDAMRVMGSDETSALSVNIVSVLCEVDRVKANLQPFNLRMGQRAGYRVPSQGDRIPLLRSRANVDQRRLLGFGYAHSGRKSVAYVGGEEYSRSVRRVGSQLPCDGMLFRGSIVAQQEARRRFSRLISSDSWHYRVAHNTVHFT